MVGEHCTATPKRVRWHCVLHQSEETAGPGTLTSGLHQLLNSESVSRTNPEPGGAEHGTGDSAEEEMLGPHGGEVVVLSDQVLSVFQLAESFSVAVVRHTSEGAVGHGLEVSISSVGSVWIYISTIYIQPRFNPYSLGSIR